MAHSFNIKRSDTNPRWWVIHRGTGAKLATAPTRKGARDLRGRLEDAWAAWTADHMKNTLRRVFRRGKVNSREGVKRS